MTEKANRQLRVFLCHSSDDKDPVRILYQQLIRNGIDAWLDEEKLLPGQNWESEIKKAVENADVVIICLSKSSINKEGFIHKEIAFALDISDEKPEDTIYLIPARIEDCPVPRRLKRWQWVDIFKDDGYKKLLSSLHLRAIKVGATTISKRKASSAKQSPSGAIGDKLSGDKIQLRSEPTILSKSNIVQMIQKKGFHHPYDWSKYGLSDSVAGNFWHEYELQTLDRVDIVVDHATGLMWQQCGASKQMTWDEARDYVKQLNKKFYAGFSDWRLPTIEELASLLESTEKDKKLHINPVFSATQKWYWGADKVEGAASRQAWTVIFYGGGVDNRNLIDHFEVRVVRSR